MREKEEWGRAVLCWGRNPAPTMLWKKEALLYSFHLPGWWRWSYRPKALVRVAADCLPQVLSHVARFSHVAPISAMWFSSCGNSSHVSNTNSSHVSHTISTYVLHEFYSRFIHEILLTFHTWIVVTFHTWIVARFHTCILVTFHTGTSHVTRTNEAYHTRAEVIAKD